MDKKYLISFNSTQDPLKFRKEWENASNEGVIITQQMEVKALNSINQLCKEAFETAKTKGWHDQPREMGTILCLIHGEVSEAMEADRRGEGWDRVTEELADVCIRIFDLCGSLNLNLEKAITEKMEYNKGRTYKHGNKAY